MSPAFLNDEDTAYLLLEPLADFLAKPLNQQYNNMFVEVYERHSTKSNVNQSQNAEAQLESNLHKL